MRIGHLITLITRPPGHERNVPGHMQHGLHALDRLAERGHDVHLITNECPPDWVFPAFMPKRATLHLVIDSRPRSNVDSQPLLPVHPARFIRQLSQTRRIVCESKLDVLHVHGYERSVAMGGLLSYLGLSCPVVATLYRPPPGLSTFDRVLWRRISAFITATQFTANSSRKFGLYVHLIRHGLVRHLLDELDEPGSNSRHRVLFWRSATRLSGADIILAAFEALAPQYPAITFTMALRPQPQAPTAFDELARRYANVEIYRLPYPAGISLAKLITESIMVVLPFREHSVHPQLVIAESLDAGVPVVTADIGSAAELVQHGGNGLLVPQEDIVATIDAICTLLDDPDQAQAMGQVAASNFARLWNWTKFAEELEAVYEHVVQAKSEKDMLL